jgi:hypothetical protein
MASPENLSLFDNKMNGQVPLELEKLDNSERNEYIL